MWGVSLPVYTEMRVGLNLWLEIDDQVVDLFYVSSIEMPAHDGGHSEYHFSDSK